MVGDAGGTNEAVFRANDDGAATTEHANTLRDKNESNSRAGMVMGMQRVYDR